MLFLATMGLNKTDKREISKKLHLYLKLNSILIYHTWVHKETITGIVKCFSWIHIMSLLWILIFVRACMCVLENNFFDSELAFLLFTFLNYIILLFPSHLIYDLCFSVFINRFSFILLAFFFPSPLYVENLLLS